MAGSQWGCLHSNEIHSIAASWSVLAWDSNRKPSQDARAPGTSCSGAIDTAKRCQAEIAFECTLLCILRLCHDKECAPSVGGRWISSNLLSHLLHSAWNPVAPNCWSLPISLKPLGTKWFELTFEGKRGTHCLGAMQKGHTTLPPKQYTRASKHCEAECQQSQSYIWWGPWKNKAYLKLHRRVSMDRLVKHMHGYRNTVIPH